MSSPSIDQDIQEAGGVGSGKENGKEARFSSERHLWEDFLRGSDAALATLYRSYADKLFNYGTQITWDRELAYDVVQDVFLNMVSKKHQLGEVISVKNYLYASYRRRLMRMLKRKRKLKLVEGYERQDGFMVEMDASVYSISTPLTINIKKELEDVCNDLPIRQREIISLYFFEELSYKEIAEIMDMTHVRSARNLLYKALGSMKEALKGREDLIFLLALSFQLK